jgi:hypothetical protein
MTAPSLATFKRLDWKWKTAITISVWAFVLALHAGLRQDPRIPAQAGWPQESAEPLFTNPANQATAFCPRDDYQLKWVVADDQFVPRCLPKHPAPVVAGQ